MSEGPNIFESDEWGIWADPLPERPKQIRKRDIDGAAVAFASLALAAAIVLGAIIWQLAKGGAA